MTSQGITSFNEEFKVESASAAGLLNRADTVNANFWNLNIGKKVLVDKERPAGTSLEPFAMGRVYENEIDERPLFLIEVADTRCEAACVSASDSAGSITNVPDIQKSKCCIEETLGATALTSEDRLAIAQKKQALETLIQTLNGKKTEANSAFQSIVSSALTSLDGQATAIKTNYNTKVEEANGLKNAFIGLDLGTSKTRVEVENQSRGVIQKVNEAKDLSIEMRNLKSVYETIGKISEWQSHDNHFKCVSGTSSSACTLDSIPGQIQAKLTSFWKKWAENDLAELSSVKEELRRAYDAARSGTRLTDMTDSQFRTFVSVNKTSFGIKDGQIQTLLENFPEGGTDRQSFTQTLTGLRQNVTTYWTYLTANYANLTEAPPSQEVINALLGRLEGHKTRANAKLQLIKDKVEGSSSLTIFNTTKVAADAMVTWFAERKSEVVSELRIPNSDQELIRKVLPEASFGQATAGESIQAKLTELSSIKTSLDTKISIWTTLKSNIDRLFYLRVMPYGSTQEEISAYQSALEGVQNDFRQSTEAEERQRNILANTINQISNSLAQAKREEEARQKAAEEAAKKAAEEAAAAAAEAERKKRQEQSMRLIAIVGGAVVASGALLAGAKFVHSRRRRK